MHERRSVTILQKVRILDTYVMCKAYYIAQLFPLPKMVAKKLRQLSCRYIWKGHIFKLRYEAISKPRHLGGLGLSDITSKASALYVRRTSIIITQELTTITSQLFTLVRPASLAPPVNVGRLHFKLRHIREFYLVVSYLGDDDLRRIVLPTKKLMDRWRGETRQNPIEQLSPRISWKTVWINVSLPIHSMAVASTWYRVVNNLIPTNDRLHRIGLCDTNTCSRCTLVDTLQHRFTCSGHLANWCWLRHQIAFLTRTAETVYTTDIILRPDFSCYPRTKTNTVMWLIGHFTYFVINGDGLDDHLAFRQYMLTAYWKCLRLPRFRETFANMLTLTFTRQGVG